MTPLDRLKSFLATATGTNTGLGGILLGLVPVINPWLVSHGWPAFVSTVAVANPVPMIGTTAHTTIGPMGFALGGAILIAARDALRKLQSPKGMQQ